MLALRKKYLVQFLRSNILSFLIIKFKYMIALTNKVQIVKKKIGIAKFNIVIYLNFILIKFKYMIVLTNKV